MKNKRKLLAIILVFIISVNIFTPIHANYNPMMTETETETSISTTTPGAIQPVITPRLDIMEDLTDHFVVTSWSLTRVNGNPLFETRIPMPEGNQNVTLHFNWTLNAPQGQFLAEDDYVTFRLPFFELAPGEDPRTGIPPFFAGLNTGGWAPIYDANNVLIAFWQVNGYDITIRVNNYAEGFPSISGSIDMYRLLNFSRGTVTGGNWLVNFHNLQSGSYPIVISTRRPLIEDHVPFRFVANRTTNNNIRWQLDFSHRGVEELTGLHGHPHGSHFTPQQDTFFEVQLAGRAGEVRVLDHWRVPVTFVDDHPYYMFPSRDHANADAAHALDQPSRIYANVGETLDAFRIRVRETPWTIGIWTSPEGIDTVLGYFGTVGEHGPLHRWNRITNMPTTFIYDQALYQRWFSAVYGTENVIDGRVPEIRVQITEHFPAVQNQTAIRATVHVTQSGNSSTLSATGQMNPVGGGGIVVPPGQATLTLTDEITEVPLQGVQFQLQIRLNDHWEDVPNSVYTTGVNGDFLTRSLANGEYRFVQINTLAGYHLPSSQGYDVIINSVVSPTFNIVGGAQGGDVAITNIRRFVVTYDFQNGNTSQTENVVHTQSPIDIPEYQTDFSRLNFVFLGWGTTNNATIFVNPAEHVVTDDVTFFAIWRAVNNVTYTITGQQPYDAPPVPPSTIFEEGDDVAVAPRPTTNAITNADGWEGVWVFDGWRCDNTVVPENYIFIMPDGPVNFTGSWIFTPRNFEIIYTVDETLAPPADTISGMPTSPQQAPAGSNQIVAHQPSTSSTMHDGVLGSWTFNGWETNEETITTPTHGTPFQMPNRDIIFTGHWTFIPEIFTVTYTVTGDLAPETTINQVPSTQPHPSGTRVYIANALDTTTTTLGDVEGTWSFSGWRSAQTNETYSFIMPNQNVTFTGYWTFAPRSVTISYEIEGIRPTPHPTVPSAVTVDSGTTQTVADPLFSSETTHGYVHGTWVFNGWTREGVPASGSFRILNDDVVFIGTWTFTPAAFNVVYEIANTLNNTPFNYSNMPATPIEHHAGTTVTVQGYPYSTDTSNRDGVSGTWTFNGWIRDDNQVSQDSTFTMPNEDVALRGIWVFTPNQYQIIYTVTGIAPRYASATPAARTTDAGTLHAVEPIPTTSDNYDHQGVRGTWMFNGWNTSSVIINDNTGDRTFIMPNHDVTFTGSWTFEASTFYVSYEVTGALQPASTMNTVPAVQSYQAGTQVTVAQPLLTNETMHNGVQGEWIFKGWTHSDFTDVTFQMPNENVLFTGYWAFIPDRFVITYTVLGEEPPVVNNMPSPSTAVYAGSSQVVASIPSTSSTTNLDGAQGTWAFVGWYPTAIIGEFYMPNHDVAFTGYWVFTHDRFNVRYEVTGTLAPPASAIVTNQPPVAQEHDTWSMVQIAQPPSTTYQYNAEGHRGTWAFVGWTHPMFAGTEFRMPNENVVFTGHWEFGTDSFSITYIVQGEAPIADNMPATPQFVQAGSAQEIAPALVTSVTTKGNAHGVWTFNGWTSDQVDTQNFYMPNDNVVFIGYWIFEAYQFDIIYTVTGVNRPPEAEVIGMPQTPQTVDSGSLQTMAQPLTTNYSYNSDGHRGQWVFHGWTHPTITGNFNMPNEHVVFTGYWIFTPDSFYVVYEVVGSRPPISQVVNMPNPLAQAHQVGSQVTVAQSPTSEYTMYHGAQGRWEFNGWHHPTITNETFMMPNYSVTFTGSWNFIPDTFTITYTVQGTLAPPEASIINPAPQHITVDSGSLQTVAFPPLTNYRYNGIVMGTWNFVGWNHPTITGTSFYMPNEDVAFTGHWTFEADEFVKVYEIIGDTPETMNNVPYSAHSIQAGTLVMVAGNPYTLAMTNAAGTIGTWTFNGWSTEDVVVNPGTFTMPNHNVTFIGYWTFVYHESPVCDCEDFDCEDGECDCDLEQCECRCSCEAPQPPITLPPTTQPPTVGDDTETEPGTVVRPTPPAIPTVTDEAPANIVEIQETEVPHDEYQQTFTPPPLMIETEVDEGAEQETDNPVTTATVGEMPQTGLADNLTAMIIGLVLSLLAVVFAVVKINKFKANQ